MSVFFFRKLLTNGSSTYWWSAVTIAQHYEWCWLPKLFCLYSKHQISHVCWKSTLCHSTFFQWSLRIRIELGKLWKVGWKWNRRFWQRNRGQFTRRRKRWWFGLNTKSGRVSVWVCWRFQWKRAAVLTPPQKMKGEEYHASFIGCFQCLKLRFGLHIYVWSGKLQTPTQSAMCYFKNDLFHIFVT